MDAETVEAVADMIPDTLKYNLPRILPIMEEGNIYVVKIDWLGNSQFEMIKDNEPLVSGNL